MSQQEPRRTEGWGPISGWVIGGIAFAGMIMMIAGAFQGIAGLVAIFSDDFYYDTQNYTFDLDVTAWGWIHLILGVLLVFGGIALFAQRAWAVVLAVVFAALSAIENFFFIPYYPLWSILIIALDLWIIWALTRPGAARA
jgi:hypothetical protein